MVTRARRVLAVAAVALGAGASCATIAGLDSTYGPLVDAGDAMPPADGTSGDDADAAPDHEADALEDGGVGRDGDAHDGISGDGGDGAPVSTPGFVACGDTSCNLSSEVCCSMTPPATARCQAGTTCLSGGTIACDEAADCLPDQVCCVADVGAGVMHAACDFDCTGSFAQACKTDRECSFGTCRTWNCGGPFNACGPPPSFCQ
jgi:hypothetical protein